MTYREGWAVAVIPIWSGEDEPEYVSDIEVEVFRLAPTNEHICGNALCARGPSGMFYPVENFKPQEPIWYDDQHDLRDHWFSTQAEAEAHAESTLNTWTHPEPWRSFVTL